MRVWPVVLVMRPYSGCNVTHTSIGARSPLLDLSVYQQRIDAQICMYIGELAYSVTLSYFVIRNHVNEVYGFLVPLPNV